MSGLKSAPAAFQRGLAAQHAGRADDAIAAYRKTIRQLPGFAPAHFNLGLLLLERGELADAAVAFEGAARLRPNAAEAWLNLGATLERMEHYDDALVAYDMLIASAPEDVRGPYNRGNALLAAGRFDQAADSFRRAIEIDEFHVDSQWNLATALLGAGHFEEGWKQYDWRWRKRGLDPESRFGWPMWAGEPVAGKRILVWREQGLGDEVMFATCLRELVAAGADVTFAATDRLVTLFERGLPGVRVVADGRWGDDQFDYHVPLGTLPRYLRTTLSGFPGESRLLVPDSAQATRWAARLGKLGAGLRVGICWRSGLMTAERARQYSTLDDWAPLFELPGVQWVNLQYDNCEAELARAEKRFGVRVHRWKQENLRDDLESVAGLLWNLDGVITAPTAVSSLAGAAGVRTWQLDVGADWTAHGHAVSPWFPSITLVRRPFGGTDWRGTMADLADQLQALVARECVVA